MPSPLERRRRLIESADTAREKALVTTTFDCRQCGAKLSFAPGERSLRCPHCGTANDIPTAERGQADAATEELDYAGHLARQAGNEPTIERQTVHCPACGADSQLAENVVADTCPFCASPIIAAAHTQRTIRPRAIAQFEIPESRALDLFRQWIRGLWFAPNELSKACRAERGLKGIYLPFWTYDANSDTAYRGERGDYYYETETHTVNGRSETRTVRRTAWRPVGGEVSVSFDDVLVIASHTLPDGLAGNIGPWQLERLEPYRDEFVSGFSLEAYQIGLEPAFHTAREQMKDGIRDAIRADIGGDEQRIAEMHPHFRDITFKHLLLPVWLSSYRYAGKSYRFIVNGQTGRVHGERPYSAWKIAGAVLLAIIVLVIGGLLFQGQ